MPPVPSPGSVPDEGPGSAKGVVSLLGISRHPHAEDVAGLFEVGPPLLKTDHLKRNLRGHPEALAVHLERHDFNTDVYVPHPII